jgi:alkylation response protein AidB-like acyl-CoA dehydrogenase
MDFAWDPDLLDFRAELRAFIQQWRTPELLREYRAREGGRGPLIAKFQDALNQRGWMKMCWPKAYGGDGRNPLYQFVFVEEMEYWGMPYGNLTYTSVAPAILAHGTEEQKKKYLPRIWSGEASFAIGYSEPNAGTDLAALRTRGERAGDHWIITGQKIWTSLAESSTHVWLAVRTNPNVPRHQGISLFIVPLDAPGVTVRPLWTLAGGRTNETFYDGVRVPHSDLVGEVDKGWGIIMHALNHERVGLAPLGNLARLFDALVEHLRDERPELLADPVVRNRLAEAKLELHRHRALATKNAWIIAGGGTPKGEASMAKIHGSELRYRLSNLAMDLLGRAGGLTAESGAAAPLEGRAESTWRMSPILRFGGGTNEVQRDIVATRGLGLPRG